MPISVSHKGRGMILLVSSINRLDEVMKRLKDNGFKAETEASKKLFFEELYVVKASIKVVETRV